MNVSIFPLVATVATLSHPFRLCVLLKVWRSSTHSALVDAVLTAKALRSVASKDSA